MCKTKARNRLKSVTTDKVLYVCCNSRLESKTKDILYREPHNQWMEAPDGANGVASTKQKNDVQVSCMLCIASARACLACMCKCSVRISSSSVR
jgi:hypothetical protein